MRRTYGQPLAVDEEELVNRHNETQTDLYVVLKYRGFRVEYYFPDTHKDESKSGAKCFLTKLVVDSDRITLSHGIRMGSTKVSVLAAYGEPFDIYMADGDEVVRYSSQFSCDASNFVSFVFRNERLNALVIQPYFD